MHFSHYMTLYDKKTFVNFCTYNVVCKKFSILNSFNRLLIVVNRFFGISLCHLSKCTNMNIEFSLQLTVSTYEVSYRYTFLCYKFGLRWCMSSRSSWKSCFLALAVIFTSALQFRKYTITSIQLRSFCFHNLREIRTMYR